jgi:hypothetical protein
MGSQFKEYHESESRFHSNNIQADIFEAFQQRLMHEAHFISNPDKRLSPEFKSYQEFFNAKVSNKRLTFSVETAREHYQGPQSPPTSHQRQH